MRSVLAISRDYRIHTHIEFCKFSSGQRKLMLLKRACDIVGGLLALAVFALPMAIAALAVRATSKGPALYWSPRVGRGDGLFPAPKFRTMRIDAPVVIPHLLGDTHGVLRLSAVSCGKPAWTNFQKHGASLRET